MQYLKKDAPLEFVEALRLIEERSDDCYGALKLLKFHSSTALWATLVGGIKRVEEQIAVGGTNTPQFNARLMNLGRSVPISMQWAIEHCRPSSRLASRRWTRHLATAVDETFFVAQNYFVFLTCFPLWHKDRYAAELLSPNAVRFTTEESARHRQVSAYHKGLRPKEGNYRKQQSTEIKPSLRSELRLAQAFETCEKTGMASFKYEDPWALWKELLPQFQASVAIIVRRPASLSLGEYTLGDFKQFYAALMAICATHEYLCFWWGQKTEHYPVNSSVLVHSRSKWITILSKVSGITAEKCSFIIGDLTLKFSLQTDLHVYPFVELDKLNLAIAPQFPLMSRIDENILRVCSVLRPGIFDVTSLEKQTEMLATLQAAISPYPLIGPIALPKPNPDIDLLVLDENSSTLVVAELKWIRKTLRPIELLARDAEVLKGIDQLVRIRQFLSSYPDYLRSVGKLSKSINEYANVHFILVARDHWPWVKPADNIAIADFEEFSAALARSGNLHSAIGELLKYEWLPVEGRDFTVRFDRATVNSVSIESQVFYPS